MEGFIAETLYNQSKRKNSLINKKIIARVLGILLFVETIMFLVCALISWIYKEKETFTFLQTAGINTLVGIILVSSQPGLGIILRLRHAPFLSKW